MGTVFGKNTTSASITVAGHKVYYIDSTDAEIVEVEKTAPLEILLGFKWNSDSSALEAVDISNDAYWSRVISQHDKELLQSLGLFVDVDFLKYGSLKKDSSYTYTVIGVYTGIGEGEIDADLLSHFTVGISSSHPTYQNVARIICDTSVPVFVKTWKCRVSIGVTTKYNAFKYLLSGTPYWYVIDGEHDTWIDDLSAWGYSEVPVGPVLPEVSVTDNWGSGNWLYANLGGSNISVWAGRSVLVGSSEGTADPVPVSYDTSKQYAVILWSTYQSSQGSGRTEYAIINSSGQIYAKNVTSENLYLYAMRVAVCSDSTATVVTVYNSSNVAYNAFKFTANNTDYYYVLDGTQTDWTDDLSSIGYSLTPNYLKGYINSSKTNAYVSRYAEKNLYDDAGNLIVGDSSKTYTIIGVYTANGGSVSYQNARLYAYENKLRFVWNDYDAYMAYIEYTVS